LREWLKQIRFDKDWYDIAKATRRRLKSFGFIYDWANLETETPEQIQETLAKAEEAYEAEARLQKRLNTQQWQVAMECPAAQRRWVRAVETEAARQRQEGPLEDPSAACKVATATIEWTKIWTMPHPTDGRDQSWEETLDQLRPLVPPGAPTPTIYFNERFMMKIAQRNKSKAAGPDGWSNAMLLELGQAWWSKFAKLCARCYADGQIPKNWALARVVLLDKPAGGTRPLSIASVAWRLFMTTTLHGMRRWIRSWATEELCGGIPGRGADMAHLKVATARETAGRPGLVFIAQDLSKAFDTVCPRQATAVLHLLGAPREWCMCIMSFYAHLERVFEYDRQVSEKWHTARHGIMQGCPASPILLAGIMQCWVHAVRKENVETTVYVDDRTLWSQDTQALARAHIAGQGIDDTFGLRLNADKTVIATASPKLADKMRTLCPTLQQGTGFKLLGLYYDLRRNGALQVPSTAVDRAVKRSKRVAVAARALRDRQHLAQTMVLPIVTWSGVAKLTRKDAQRLRTSLAATTGGSTAQGACNTLRWESLSKIEFEPDTAILLRMLTTCVRHEQQKAQATPERVQGFAVTTHKAIWDTLSEYEVVWQPNIMLLSSPHGATANLLSDSRRHIRQWAKQLAQKQMWAAEKRVWTSLHREDEEANLAQGLDLPAPPDNFCPQLQAHREAAITTGSFLWRRIACGAGFHTWETTAKFRTKAPCMCGKELPSTAHLVWTCEATADLRTQMEVRAPTHRAEERLLVSGTGPPPVVHVAAEHLVAAPDPALVRMLRKEAGHDDSKHALVDTKNLDPVPKGKIMILATDGSSEYNVATWAVSSTRAVVAAQVKGDDGSPFKAELEGLRQLAVCLVEAKIRNTEIWVFVDCTAAIDIMQARSPPLYMWALWSSFRNSLGALAKWKSQIHLVWVPSHGKQRTGWGTPGIHSDLAIALNDRVDQAARCLLKQIVGTTAFKGHIANLENAASWSRSAIKLAAAVGERFLAHCESFAAGHKRSQNLH
jgi:hypothetical protein